MGLKLAAAAREAAEETGIDPLRILRSLTREGGPADLPKVHDARVVCALIDDLGLMRTLSQTLRLGVKIEHGCVAITTHDRLVMMIPVADWLATVRTAQDDPQLDAQAARRP